MFWPVYYSLVLFSLVIIGRSFKRYLAILIIGGCALMQVLDTRIQWLAEKHVLEKASIDAPKNPLKNPFWADAGKKYSELVRVPAKNNSYDWAIFADYASSNAMATNSVFLARFDESKLIKFNQALDADIANGKYKSSSLYVVEDGEIIPVLMSLDESKHLFALIDGYNVLAPFWKECHGCTLSGEVKEYVGFLDVLRAKRKFQFSDRSDDRLSLALLSKGWGKPETWGVWSGEKKTRLTIPIPKINASELSFEFRALVSEKLPSQKIKIFINDQYYGDFVLSQGDGNKIDLKITEKMKQKNFIVLDFELPDAAKPIDLGITKDDERLLSIGLVSVGWH
jgi:hypothetical protein